MKKHHEHLILSIKAVMQKLGKDTKKVDPHLMTLVSQGLCMVVDQIIKNEKISPEELVDISKTARDDIQKLISMAVQILIIDLVVDKDELKKAGN